MKNKHTGSRYIAYFQAYTNTYAPVPVLEKIFSPALAHPQVAAISIATRPDCLDEEKVRLLSRLSGIKPVWVELGLQTIHEDTAAYIRRGYDLSCFHKALALLQSTGWMWLSTPFSAFPEKLLIKWRRRPGIYPL